MDPRATSEDNHDCEDAALIGLAPTAIPTQPPSSLVIYVVALTILFQFEEVVQAAPTYRLTEYAVCQQHYRDSSFPVEENLCKIEAVQARVAFIRGWQVVFDALPSMQLNR
jgi:hypothetical protein